MLSRMISTLGLAFICFLSTIAQNYVTLYSDCGFQGTATKLYEGRHPLSGTSIGSYSLSSLRIPSGFKVVLYTGTEPGTGTKTRYENDVNCLPREWNDKVGAVIVERTGSNSGGGYNPGGDYNNSGSVVVYADCDYRGRSKIMGDGEYNLYALGVGNDQISSIQIPRGWSVVIYADGDYKGASRTMNNSVNCLDANWNDKISSMRVYRPGNSPGSGGNGGYYPGGGSSKEITVYADCNYQGSSARLRIGSYNKYQLGVGNDKISSMRIPRGVRITAYADDNFGGERREFSYDVPCLNGDWNDKISSLRVYADNNDGGYNNGNNNGGVTIYNNSGLSGTNRSYGPGAYDLSGTGFDVNISSIKVSPGYTIELYDDYDFRGARYTLSYTAYNLSTLKWNDRVRSFIVRRN